MPVKKLNNDHKKSLLQYLSNYQDSSLFMLGNIYQSGIYFVNQPYHADYFGSFSKEGNINGVLAHYWNGSLMMQAESNDILAEIIELFISSVNRPIAQLLGLDDQVLYVIETLGFSDANFSSNTQEQLYRINLDDFNSQHSDIKNYYLVPAAETDENILSHWLRDYEIQTLNAENNQSLSEYIKKRVIQIQSQKFSHVLNINKTPVALCGSNSNLKAVIQIGPVWTPPEHRNNGYAKLLLTEVLLKARETGVRRAVLFSDNPIAIKVYTAIGFKHFGYYRWTILKHPLTINKTNKTPNL